MRRIKSEDGEHTAKAQRLPAIETRLIDGAVMRMARIVGGAIACDEWLDIKKELENGVPVRVPIITESNRFEFEPSLRELKGRRSNERTRDLYAEKDERIRSEGQRVCPYTGESMSGDDGDKDHIVPRSSEWGVLNDEANLIWASDKLSLIHI